MNNNNLIKIINLYGGNDDPQIYTSSVLSKYNNLEDKVIIKINNLETLLIGESDSDSENDNIFKLIGGSKEIIHIDNLEILLVEESETFTEFVSYKINNL